MNKPRRTQKSQSSAGVEIVPPTVNILGHTYTCAVSDLTDIPEAKNPQETWGISVHRNLQLRVRNDLAPEMTLSTFVHEVAHAVAAQSGGSNFMSDKAMEFACDLAGATVMCLLDNGVLSCAGLKKPAQAQE